MPRDGARTFGDLIGRLDHLPQACRRRWSGLGLALSLALTTPAVAQESFIPGVGTKGLPTAEMLRELIGNEATHEFGMELWRETRRKLEPQVREFGLATSMKVGI